MFIHAQKVFLYLTSYPSASPFSWLAIWPPPACYLCLLSRLVFLSPPVPHKHSLCSSSCGGKCKATAGRSQGWEKAWNGLKPQPKSRHRQHQRHMHHNCQALLPTKGSHYLQPFTYSLSPFPSWDQVFKRAELWFRPHFGVPSDLGETGDLVEHSARSCSHQGFPKTSLSEVVEVTYWPDCLFVFKSVSISEDLSPFWRLFLLFYSRILKAKVKQYVNNTVHCDCGSHHVITS